MDYASPAPTPTYLVLRVEAGVDDAVHVLRCGDSRDPLLASLDRKW